MKLIVEIPDSVEVKSPAELAGYLSQIASKMNAANIETIGNGCAKQKDLVKFNKKLASGLKYLT